MKIWTIGHSTRPIEEFVTLLRTYSIELVADVRSYPGSKKFPHFNKSPLRETLSKEGIEYRHFPGLGGMRRKVRKDSKNTGWRSKGFQAYADHMETEEFIQAVAELIRAAEEKQTAIMCAEALWWRCHRRLISDYLKVRGHQVIHIIDVDKREEHAFSTPAKVENGVLSYEGE
jgi:uncharacterized protein (DUF488 family)